MIEVACRLRFFFDYCAAGFVEFVGRDLDIFGEGRYATVMGECVGVWRLQSLFLCLLLFRKEA